MTIGALFVALTPASHAAGESYLCVADLVTGFKMSQTTKEWFSTTFTPSSIKFIISRPKELPPNVKAEWVVRDVGYEVPNAVCEKDFDSWGQLHCSGFSTYQFSKRSLRFVYTHTFGFWNDDDGNELLKPGKNNPIVAIGKCTTF